MLTGIIAAVVATAVGLLAMIGKGLADRKAGRDWVKKEQELQNANAKAAATSAVLDVMRDDPASRREQLRKRYAKQPRRPM
jgi:hypothetical protein